MSEICGSCGRNVADYYSEGYRCAVCMGFRDELTLVDRLNEMANNHEAIGAEGDARDIRDALRVVAAAADLADFYRDRSRHITVTRLIEALGLAEGAVTDPSEPADTKDKR